MSLVVYCYFLKNNFILVVVWSLCEATCLLLNCVNAQQTANITQTTATLSEARCCLAATSLGELVFFGGGLNATGPSDRVDICNVTSRSWTMVTLSVPRWDLAAASSGNLVFFAGGSGGTVFPPAIVYSIVDIYNISDRSWSTTNLSQARSALAATSVGNLVLFGGGLNGTYTDPNSVFNVVDIYNITNDTWTTATLSHISYNSGATSLANRYALFAGGFGATGYLNIVNVYDSLSGMWSTATLSQARELPATTSLGNLSFFGGGWMAGLLSNIVDIYDLTSQTWSTATLSQNRSWLAAAAIGDIVAFGGGTPNGFASSASAVVDMYNVTSNIWFTASLSQPRNRLAATSSTNKIFFGGGQNSSSGYSDVVDIFDIPSASPPPNAPVSITPPNFTMFPQSLSTNVPLSVSNTTISTSVPPHTSANAQNVNNNADNTTALLAGILSAVAVLIIAAIILLIVLLRKKRKNKKLKSDRNAEQLSVEDRKSETVVLESITNKITLNETNTTMLKTYQPGIETLKKLSPDHIPLNELKIKNEIGEGTYGRVCVGKWRKYRVALKFCQNRGKMDEFLREANLMISLPPHPNVVRVYGVSIDGTQPIIVMEYCAGGSLDKLLYDTDEKISDEQKIRWVHEIALGMCHLHKHNIVHRDLAARNILLSHSNLADAHTKISDFGMSRVLQQEIEGKTKTLLGPIRWMAPESIGQHTYSKKSDVWMFGVLVYEIVARCEPHTDIAPNDVALLIRDKGLTPVIPSDCPQKLRQTMEICWNKQPEQRPNFEEICTMLRQ